MISKLPSAVTLLYLLNITEIAKRAGINTSLMHQYTSGVKNAGEKTYERLSLCMEDIKKELQVARF